MKDSLLLLSAGIASSSLAWAFWHYLGNDGFGVLNTLFLVAAIADNIRLRRKLRDAHPLR